MGLRIERIPTLNDNYTYLVICEKSGDAAVIDAPEVEPVVARVKSEGARVTKLLTTHHHADHCMANPDLARLFDVPVFGHVSDAPTPGATSPTSSTTRRPCSRETRSSRGGAAASSRVPPR
jgi:hydroxyacylglutathione hydrolase